MTPRSDPPPPTSERLYVVYDQRADELSGTDDAHVLVSESTLEKAMRWQGPWGYVWGYDVARVPGQKAGELVNETFIGPTRKRGHR